MRVNNNPLVVNQVLSANFNSAPQQLNQVYGYSIQGTITGTPTGTFHLEASTDPNSGNIFPTNWTTVDNSSKAVSSAGTFMYNVSEVFYNWVRLSYVDSSSGSSTAILNANVDIKGF